ncbi:MAG: glycosyltransferase family 2 protein [Candidatus Limivicinus sp.]
MLAKVLKKLGLGHGAYRLAAPFCSARYQGAAAGSAEEALALLHETSPDIGSSCHIPPRQPPAGPAAELDIIVPAYNVEKYIAQCVSSVLEQETKHSFRLLVIDDGSTDTTGSILDGFQGLTVIHQENRGFSGARNRGLELANADYLMFLDSDDCLCPGAIESLMDAAREHEAWIVEGSYTEVDTAGQVIRRHSHMAGALDPVRDCEGYVWGKVIRRELFRELAFPKDYWYQDSIVRQILLPLAKEQGRTVWGVENSIVRYRQNPGGITKKSRSRGKSLDSLYITMHLFRDRQCFGLSLTEHYYDYLLSMCPLTYSRTHLQSQEVRQAVFTVYADFMQRNFPDWHTQNRRLACLEKALRTGDYGSYLAYCRLH